MVKQLNYVWLTAKIREYIYGTAQIQRRTRSTFFVESRVRVERVSSRLTFLHNQLVEVDIQPRYKGIQFSYKYYQLR